MADDRERDEGGRYTTEIQLGTILKLFDDIEPRTASEVAEVVGISRRSAYDKLQQLHEQGELKKKKVGGRSVVWWRDIDRLQPD